MIQTEKLEYILTSDGELVQVAANKKHSQMSDDKITDTIEDGYIFSNTKSMRLKKKDFENITIAEEIPDYKEGFKPKEYKATTFADRYFYKKKQTPAETIAKIQKIHPVVTDDNQKWNPYVQQANRWNKENRQPYVDTVTQASEAIKPYAEAEDTGNPENALEIAPQFKYGGDIKKFKYGGSSNSKFKVDSFRKSNGVQYMMKGGKIVPVNKYQDGGDVLGGAASGASAGAAIGSIFFPGPGTAIGGIAGALIGGVGSFFTGRSQKKAKEKALKEQAAYIARQKELSKQMTEANMMGTAAQALIPNYINERADYSDNISNINNTYDRINRNYDTSTANMMANATSSGNSMLRTLAPQLGQSQLQNIAANTLGQNFRVANQIGSQREDMKNRFAIDRTNQVNNLDIRQDDINRDYTNAEGYAEVDKMRRLATDFTANRVDGLSRDSQIDTTDYTTRRAVELGQAAQAQAAQGRFNNTLLQAGNAAANIINTRSTPGNPTGTGSDWNNMSAGEQYTYLQQNGFTKDSNNPYRFTNSSGEVYIQGSDNKFYKVG